MKMEGFSLRLTEEENEKLKYISKYNGRTKNMEIVVLIRRHILEFERDHGKIQPEDIK